MRTIIRPSAGSILSIIAITGTAAILACGGDSGPTGPGGGGEPTVASVRVTPGADTLLALGDTVRLDATALDASGNPIPDITFTWSSSNDGVVAITDQGEAVAVANGSADIVATANGVSGQAALAVIQQVSAVAVSPATATLSTTGATQTFSASATDANGNAVTDAVFVWQAENHAVATVDSAGTATSHGSGETTITATAQDVPGHAVLTVNQAIDTVVFRTEPTSAGAGEAIDPAVQVAILDASGAVVTDADAAVTVALGTDPSGGAASLGGSKTVNATNGVATFSGLWIDAAATGYTLEASVGGAGSATSGSFDIAPGPAARLAFTAQPVDTTAGDPLGDVQVEVQDAFGNPVPGATGTVNISLAANPGGGTLMGAVTTVASGGVANFSSLAIDRASPGYALQASASGLEPGLSDAFEIVAGPPSRLGFAVQPSTTPTAIAISPAVQVEVEDEFGNAVGAGTQQIRIELDANSHDATLGGTNTALASTGVATFSDIFTFNPGSYNLRVTSDGLQSAVSQTFDIRARFKDAAAGGFGSCALTAAYPSLNGDMIFCWGTDYPFSGVKTTPRLVLGNGGQLSAGTRHACASGGAFVWCWGASSYGQTGRVAELVESPYLLSLPDNILQVSAGGSHTCAITTANELYCWGLDDNGQLGDGTPSSGPTSTPTQVADPASGAVSWVQVSAGFNFTCALTSASEAYCWGDGTDGRLGNGGTVDAAIPQPVSDPASGAVTWAGISAGDSHACGYTITGAAFCWGSNTYGGLGTGSTGGTSSVPVAVTDPSTGAVSWSTVDAGGGFTCGMDDAAEVYCWGWNYGGSLARGTYDAGDPTPAPIVDPVTGPVTWSTLDAGGAHACATTISNVAYCWGDNNDGTIGDGTAGNEYDRSVPTRIVQ